MTIYLDYQATTPLAPEALAAMLPWLERQHANPHSAHAEGRAAKAAIEAAREEVAAALGVSNAGLHFTSGATEAANWAIKGAATRATPERRRIITIVTEHACVRDAALWLADHHFEPVLLPVDRHGLIDLAAADAAIDDRTALVAAMLVNNEIGVIQPIAELSRLARGAGALFFCDAVQGFGRAPVPVDACDMIAITAHKVHGPKGVGALWIRDGVVPEPLLHGGGQEGGIRSGTLSPSLCAGFGAAARLLRERAEVDTVHVRSLWGTARAALSVGWIVNGSVEDRYHGNLNIRFPGLDVARLMSDLRDISFAAGSACASGSGRPSHVLRAIGLSDAEARASIRVGFGRYTSEAELVDALTRIDAAARAQRFGA